MEISKWIYWCTNEVVKSGIRTKEYRICVFLFFGLGAISSAKSQQSDSLLKFHHPIEREVRMAQNPWLSIDNAAGWHHHFQPLYNELALKVDHSSGDFHRPQSAEKEFVYGLHTSGYRQLNGNLLYGKFGYSKRSEKDVQWNLMNDPYNGNRMLMADSIGGDWKGYDYSLSAGIALKPIFDRVVIGMKIDYSANTSARDNDPRPESMVRDIAVSPGLCFHINPQNHIGTSFSYRSQKEEVMVNNMSGTGSNMIYTMFGLREWLQPRDRISETMLNVSDRYKSGIQYELNKGKNIWFTSFEYTYRKDENKFDPYGSFKVDNEVHSQNIPMGEYMNNQYRLATSFTSSVLKGLHRAEIQFISSKGKLWDASTKHVSFFGQQRNAHLKYHFYRQSFEKIPWKTGFTMQYSSIKCNELFYANEKIENINLNINGNKYFYLHKKNILEFGIQLQAKINLKESLVIDPQSDFIVEKTLVSEQIIRPNHAFALEEYNEIKLLSLWSFPVDQEINGFIKGEYHFAISEHQGNFSASTISVGILF